MNPLVAFAFIVSDKVCRGCAGTEKKTRAGTALTGSGEKAEQVLIIKFLEMLQQVLIADL